MGILHANRGRTSEEIIEFTNELYARKKWAKIQKVSTPMKPVWEKGRIKTAYYSEQSTVDYIGVAFGQSIAFDVKSTRETKRFPLANVKQHQVDFLVDYQTAGGISFLLVEFMRKTQWFLIPLDKFLPYWDRAMAGGKKSIHYSEFKNFIPVRVNKFGVDYLEFLRT